MTRPKRRARDRDREGVPAMWAGVCANCGGPYPAGALIVRLHRGYRSTSCCPEEAP